MQAAVAAAAAEPAITPNQQTVEHDGPTSGFQLQGASAISGQHDGTSATPEVSSDCVVLEIATETDGCTLHKDQHQQRQRQRKQQQQQPHQQHQQQQASQAPAVAPETAVQSAVLVPLKTTEVVPAAEVGRLPVLVPLTSGQMCLATGGGGGSKLKTRSRKQKLVLSSSDGD